MRRPKVAGLPRSPIGVTFQWNEPIPGIVNAVNGRDSGANGICQKPAVRSRDEKTVDFARPIVSMQSLTSRWLYLSTYDLSFNFLKSSTALREPSFFGTQNMGELNMDLEGEITFN